MLNVHFSLLFIPILGAFLSFFAALVIHKANPGNLKANKWLSLFFAALSAYLLRGILLLGNFYPHFPIVIEILDNVRYFLGPLIYFHIKTVIDPDTRLKKRDLLHLAPLVLNLLVQIPFYLKTSECQVQYLFDWLYAPIFQAKFYGNGASRFVFFIAFIYYLIASIRLHRSFADQIKAVPHYGPMYLSWMRIFTYSLSISLILLLIIFIRIMLGYSIYHAYYTLNIFTAAVSIFCFARFLLRPEILFHSRSLKSNRKYRASRLTSQDMAFYFEKITALMEQERIYLDPDLDLLKLAEILAIPRNYLSQIINAKTGKSFNDFINFYRVEKTKQAMQETAQGKKTIRALALKAGFKSKASFLRAFKKCTGESPAAFRQKNRQ